MGAKAQFYSLRTNALQWAVATPNIGFSVELSRKFTFDVDVLVNPLKTPEFSMQGIALQEGFRYWFMEANIGTFLGIHLTEAVYNVGNKSNMYKGFLAGAGLSVGYSWLISKRWNVAVELGGSVLYMQDSRHPIGVPHTEDEIVVHSKRIVVAPTKCAVSFVYMF